MKFARAATLSAAVLFSVASMAPAEAQNADWVYCTAGGGDHFYMSDPFKANGYGASTYKEEWDPFVDGYSAGNGFPEIEVSHCIAYASYDDAWDANDDLYDSYYDQGYDVMS